MQNQRLFISVRGAFVSESNHLQNKEKTSFYVNKTFYLTYLKPLYIIMLMFVLCFVKYS